MSRHTRLLRLTAILTFFVAIGWLIVEPGFEPMLAILGSVGVFLSPLFFKLVDETLRDVPEDECESLPEIQVGDLDTGNAEPGSGGVSNFLADYQAYFGGRQDEMDELDTWLTQHEKRLGLLVAPAGMGKSALVANWIKRLEDRGQVYVAYHPISLRYGTNNQKQTAHNLLMTISKIAVREVSSKRSDFFRKVIDLIAKSYNAVELKELCLHLGKEYDDLGGEGTRGKIIELVKWCSQTNRLSELVATCQKERSHLDWPIDIPETDSKQLSYEPPQADEDETLLSSRLRETLRQSTQWKKPLVVIIDGLDELAHQLNRPNIKPIDFLPNQVGKDIYILTVARGESNNTRDAWHRALGWERSPVQFFTLGKLQKQEIEKMVSRSNITQANFLDLVVDKLYELSEQGDRDIASSWIDWLVKRKDKDTHSLLHDLVDHLGKLQKQEIEEMVSRSNITQANLLDLVVDELYELSEQGDPLIASLWIDWLVKRKDKDTHSLLDALVGQTPGINTYIEGILAQINPLMEGGVKPLLELLSLARGPVLAQDLYALGINVESKQLENLVNLSGRLIVQIEKAYVFGHSRIRQAVQEEFVSEERRRDWLGKFHNYGRCSLKRATKIPGWEIPQYILNYYAEHLYMDQPEGYEPSLYALVNEIWMKAHYDRSGNYDDFLRDVDWALSISERSGKAQISRGESVEQIALQIKGLMIHTSITSLSSNVPPLLPALLVRDEIWNPRQAVSHVLRIPNLMQRAQALVALLTVEESKQIFSKRQNQTLYDVIISSSLQTMQLLWQQNKVDESELYELQLAISPALSVIYVNDALQLADNVQRAIWQARLLAELFPLIEDEAQQVVTIKKLIHACSKIDHTTCSEDFHFIFPTFTAIAQNISMEHLVTAFAEVWEEESQTIREQEKIRTQKKYILDYLAWHIEAHQAITFLELLLGYYDSLPEVAERIARFANKLDDEIAYKIAARLFEEQEKIRTQKKYILDYLAIEAHQAITFLELLQAYYDSLPEVAERIARFANKLDDEIACKIAAQLFDEFKNSPRTDTRTDIGIGLITLASVCKGKNQAAITKIIMDYMKEYGEKEFPHSGRDLQLFYEVVTEDLTDSSAAGLVKQGEFMSRFWGGRCWSWIDEKANSNSSDLSMYSQELVAYLGIETLKVLFERCLNIGVADSAQYWDITGSPYILPAIAKKLPDEELALIYQIGHARWNGPCGTYGYIRSAIENVKRMPEVLRLDTIDWLWRYHPDSDIKQAIAPLITPDFLLKYRKSRGYEDRKLIEKNLANISTFLPKSTVQYIVRNFNGFYDYFNRFYDYRIEKPEIFLLFVQYLPANERKPFLQRMMTKLFHIVDNAERYLIIESIERYLYPPARRNTRQLRKKVRAEMINNDLLTLETLTLNPFFILLEFFSQIVSVFTIFIRRYDRFNPYVVPRAFEKQRSFFKFLARQIGLLRFNKLSYQLILDQQAEIQVKNVGPSNLADEFWYSKLYDRSIRVLASSRIIWVFYLLSVFVIAFASFLLFSTLVILISILWMFIIGIYSLFFIIGVPIFLVYEFLRYRFSKEESESLFNIFTSSSYWSKQSREITTEFKENIKERVRALNQLSEEREREKAFLEIGDAINEKWIIRLDNMQDYKKYAYDAPDIWSELKSEFVLDAINAISNRFEDNMHDYILAIIPAVVLRNKTYLPRPCLQSHHVRVQ